MAHWLWGEHQPAQPGDQVAVLVSRLRSVLGADRVRRSDAGYSLDLQWVDVDALAELVEEAELRRRAGAIPAARAAAAAALALLRGPLLADEPDPWWAEAEQARVLRLVARAHHVAAAAALDSGDPRAAIEHGEGALAGDPYDETALRLLMRAYAASGRTASALARYASTRQQLAEDLGLSPAPETEALHLSLLTSDDPGDQAPEGSLINRDEPFDLPGRSEALRTLHGALSEAVAGHGSVIVVAGEAGLGKTRLLQTWAHQASQRGARVVTTSCHEQGRELPLQPLFDALEDLLRSASDDEAAAQLGAEAAVLGPLLGRSALNNGPAQWAALTDPGAGEALLYSSISAVLRRQSLLRPLVVLVDDLHLAGPATLAWLSHAERRLADSAVVVVVTQRPEEPTGFRGGLRLELHPLDLAAVVEVVGHERATDLFERSGGHPLFLRELARAETDEELPVSLRDAITDRCARSGAAAKTLQVAAVIGAEVDLDLLAVVTGQPPSELLDHLEEGLRRKLLVETGSSFAFGHALIQEALAGSMSASRRRYIHAQVGRSLAARRDADPVRVAYHARLGGDAEQTSSALGAAARLAIGRFDQREALRLLDDAIALHDSVAGRLLRARVNSLLGHHADATADIQAAIVGGAGAEAMEEAAWSAHLQRDFVSSLRWARLGAQQATTDDVRANCLSIEGWTSLAVGDLAGAETCLTRAVAETALTTHALPSVWLGSLRVNQGRCQDALDLTAHGGASESEVHLFPNAYAAMITAMALGMLGRPDEALVTLDRMDADIARMDAHRWGCRAHNVRGWVLRNLGAISEAHDLNHLAVEEARSVDLVEAAANGLLDLVCGEQLRGRHAQAWELLDQADRLAEGQHAFVWRHRMRARLLRARSCLAEGELGQALEFAGALAADAGRDGIVRYEVQARLVEASALRRSGRAVNLDQVALDLDRLTQVAGLEAWWITAGVAEVFGADAWYRLAEQRATYLMSRAGPHGASLTALVENVLVH
ncbi:MAG: putative DNA-binding protein [Acidimicrobiia bacterium]|nr:putative DNA-binding protein [Acidimicrobiia bacterium]